jgi:hypothetical protein
LQAAPNAVICKGARLAAALVKTALGLAGADGWPRLVAKYNSSLIEIVGCHLHRDTVSGDHSNPVSLHAACGVGNNGVSIVHLHAYAAVREDFDDRAFEFEHFFLRHPNSFASQYPNRAAISRPALTGAAQPPVSSPSFGLSIPAQPVAGTHYCVFGQWERSNQFLSRSSHGCQSRNSKLSPILVFGAQ